ncbi:GNAT family N-acetyltransferase [Galenea microaerophila]
MPLTLLSQFSQQLKQQQHRGLVVLQGELDWQMSIWQQWVNQVHQHAPRTRCLQIDTLLDEDLNSTKSLSQLSPQACRHLLGQEADHAFFSLQSPAGIDLNALGIVTGLLTVGGLCFIGVPEQPQPNPASQRLINFPYSLKDCQAGFYHHLLNTLQPFKMQILWLKPEMASITLPKLENPTNTASPSPDLMPTCEQQQAIQAIAHVAFGHRHRPLVLTAERGRGKSAALGMAAALCLQQGKTHIGLTASRKTQIQGVLQFCAYFLTQNVQNLAQNFDDLPEFPVLPRQFVAETLIQERDRLSIQDTTGQTVTLQFYAPDALLATLPEVDILLVDEAASLPLPVLEGFLTRFSRLVFATTLQGYEGSGRGFGLKFAQMLAKYQWRHLELKSPIRWAEQDPLETWVNALLLAPKQVTLQQSTPRQRLNHYSISELPTQTLWQRPQTLQAIFELLASAHYQTQPNDLLQLLEAPHIKLWVAQQAGKVMGVLLVTEEGGLPHPQQQTTLHFQGHLMPQQLFRHSLNPEWLNLKSWRILRLAVSPEWQQQGMGSALVQHALRQAAEAGLQAVSTSFGATADLVAFWRKQGFAPLYLGLKKDAASASHALTMLYPLTDKAQQLTQQQQADYHPQFAHLLNERPFSQLPLPLLYEILQGLRYPPTAFPNGYLQGQPFEAVSFQLKQWALSHAEQLSALPESFCLKVCQNHSWQSLNASYGSRKQLEKLWKKCLYASNTTVLLPWIRTRSSR